MTAPRPGRVKRSTTKGPPTARRRKSGAKAPLAAWVEYAAEQWRETNKSAPPRALVGPFKHGKECEDAVRLWQAVERAQRADDDSFNGECCDRHRAHAVSAAMQVIDIAARAEKAMRSPLRPATEKAKQGKHVAAKLRAAAAIVAYEAGSGEGDPESVSLALFQVIRTEFFKAFIRHMGEVPGEYGLWERFGRPGGVIFYHLGECFAAELPALLDRAADAAEAWGHTPPMAPKPESAGARRYFFLRLVWKYLAEVFPTHIPEPFADEIAWRIANLLMDAEDSDTGLSLRDAKRAISKWKKSRP